MKSSYEPLGKYIREIDVRNEDMAISKLIGVSMEKTFIPSVANIVGTDMSVYKVINNGQLACKLMSVGRDEKLPVDLYNNMEPAIVSSAYYVFEPMNTTEVLPEYLLLWLSRPESDRYIGFISGGDVRGGISWDTFCSMPIKVPDLDKQKVIVKEYNTVTNRIKLNKQLIQKLEETAQAIYKQWFVEFEFPDESGNPYKSNGGEMVESELGEVPKGWRIGELRDIADYAEKKIPITKLTPQNYISTENMIANKGGVFKLNDLPQATNVTQFTIGDILISNIRPYLKKIWTATFDGGCSNDVLCFKPSDVDYSEYLYYTIERDVFFEYVMAGSKGTKMPRGDKNWTMKFPIVISDEQVLEKFHNSINCIKNMVSILNTEIVLLKNLSSVILSKLATIEN